MNNKDLAPSWRDHGTNLEASKAPFSLPGHHYLRWGALVLVEYLLIAWALWAALQDISSWYNWAGLLSSLLVVVAVAKYSSRKADHGRAGRLGRGLALLALAPLGYGSFALRQGASHGGRAIAADDPARLRFGEGFVEFFPRSLTAGIQSAWKAERERSTLIWSLANGNLLAGGLTLVLFAGLIAWQGWAVLPLLMIQALLGVMLLEFINFREQYRFQRQLRLLDDLESPTESECLQGSDHSVANILFFYMPGELGLGANRAQSLQHVDSLAPVSVTAQLSMFLQSFLAPLWVRAVNPEWLHYQRSGSMLPH